MRKRGRALEPKGLRPRAALLAGTVLTGLVFLLAPTASAEPDAGRLTGFATQAQQVGLLEQETTGLRSPSGLAFSPANNAFYVIDASPGGPRPAATEVVTLTPFDLIPFTDRSGSTRIAATVRDPINMAFDARYGRLLLLSGDGHLLEVQASPNGDLLPETLVAHEVTGLGLQSPQGMAVDPASGDVFVLDARIGRIVRLQPEADGSFDAATVSEIYPQVGALTRIRGLAFDAASGNLYLGAGLTLYELTQAGSLVGTFDLSGADLANPQGMVIAPSADQTDDPATTSLYVADGGGITVTGGGRPPGSAVSTLRTGRILELSLSSPPAAFVSFVAASDFESSLVETIDAAQWSPPSPDPSGITFISGSSRLVVVDGEVEETVGGITHFDGANLWETTLGGSVIRSANISKKSPTVVPMTDEPTGITFDPASGHYFVTEDGGKRVYNLNPGADQLIGTSDDTWTFFGTNVYGNGDPEGIAFDTANSRLLVADGTNREIYIYTTTGALVGQFDVQAYGVEDPETVEFNAQSGTAFVLSNRQSGPIVIETTMGGALLQTIDVSASNAHKPAGLAFAPASDGSGAMRFYVADRGIDNNDNPNIVDGKIYEMTAPGSGGGENQPPVITSDGGGPTAAISVPENQTAVTDVNATDTDPITYSIAGGDDAARFAINTGSGVLTFLVTPNFEAPTDLNTNNVYEVTIGASDGTLSDTQAISVTVTDEPEGGPQPALHFSLRSSATVGGVTAANEDILFFNGASFSLAFDGSDVGLSSRRLDGFAFLDSDTLLLSFDADGLVLPGISEPVDESDIIRFDASSLGSTTLGNFQAYFDGSDVGLTTSAHDLDAVEVLSDGRIVLSTRGKATVAGVTVADEDLLAFTPTQLGTVTSGSADVYFDGSDVALSGSEDVDAAAVDATGKLHLSTADVFAVTGVSGQDEDVFVFTPISLGSTTAGTYSSTLTFDGSAFGLDANDVLDVDIP